MFRDIFAAIAISSMGLCQSSSSPSEPTPSGWTCEDYQLMIDVEFEVLQACSDNAECTQVLDGLGGDCESDTPIVNAEANASYIYDMVEEAEGYGCSIDIATSGFCSEDAEAVCQAGVCGWTE